MVPIGNRKAVQNPHLNPAAENSGIRGVPPNKELSEEERKRREAAVKKYGLINAGEGLHPELSVSVEGREHKESAGPVKSVKSGRGPNVPLEQLKLTPFDHLCRGELTLSQIASHLSRGELARVHVLSRVSPEDLASLLERKAISAEDLVDGLTRQCVTSEQIVELVTSGKIPKDVILSQAHSFSRYVVSILVKNRIVTNEEVKQHLDALSKEQVRELEEKGVITKGEYEKEVEKESHVVRRDKEMSTLLGVALVNPLSHVRHPGLWENVRHSPAFKSLLDMQLVDDKGNITQKGSEVLEEVKEEKVLEEVKEEKVNLSKKREGDTTRKPARTASEEQRERLHTILSDNLIHSDRTLTAAGRIILIKEARNDPVSSVFLEEGAGGDTALLSAGFIDNQGKITSRGIEALHGSIG